MIYQILWEKFYRTRGSVDKIPDISKLEYQLVTPNWEMLRKTLLTCAGVGAIGLSAAIIVSRYRASPNIEMTTIHDDASSGKGLYPIEHICKSDTFSMDSTATRDGVIFNGVKFAGNGTLISNKLLYVSGVYVAHLCESCGSVDGLTAEGRAMIR